jgi:hypothetical protein
MEFLNVGFLFAHADLASDIQHDLGRERQHVGATGSRTQAGTADGHTHGIGISCSTARRLLSAAVRFAAPKFDLVSRFAFGATRRRYRRTISKRYPKG